MRRPRVYRPRAADTMNTKPNFNNLVDDLAELLEGHYGVRSTVKHRKRAPSVPAPDEVLQDLVAQCDLVITGSGD